MALAPEIIEATANANLKNVGEAPAFYASLAMGNAVSHQQSMNQVALAATGNIVKYLTEADPAQAASILKTLSTGGELPQIIAALSAVLSGGQQGAKTAQTTPPTTP